MYSSARVICTTKRRNTKYSGITDKIYKTTEVFMLNFYKLISKEFHTTS